MVRAPHCPLSGHRLSPVNGEFAFARLGRAGSSSPAILLGHALCCGRSMAGASPSARSPPCFGPSVSGQGSSIRAPYPSTSRSETPSTRTGFTGIWRVPGGHTISFDGVRVKSLRWFRPEKAATVRTDLDEAGTRVREALSAAIGSRASGQRVALLLTGVRDSGAWRLPLWMQASRRNDHLSDRPGLEAVGARIIGVPGAPPRVRVDERVGANLAWG